jgi:ABC-2 type transport system permease protein
MRTTLLRPFWWSARNRFFPPGPIPVKSLLILGFGLVVDIALYLITVKVVGYFHRQNELGVILSLKIFQMGWIILFVMLFFSCLVSAVSSIFLSQDNEIVFAAPVAPAELYFMRYWTVTLYTGWMMVFFSVPVFAAFGTVFGANWPYWPLMVLAVVAISLIATGLGLFVTVILVNLFPARQTKDIVMYLSLCFGIFITLIFRMMRPEELANPDKYSYFLDYLSSISTPAGPYVPAAWAVNLLSLYLMDREVDWLLFGLLLVSPCAMYLLGEWAMQRWFFSGYSKSQESFGGYRRFLSRRPYRPAFREEWIYKKEGLSFLRDSTEWSQLFMVGALIVIYLYNFKVLPMDRSFMRQEYLANLIAFLNIGLTGFVMTSLSARFVFPSIGAEGGSFYLIRSSPLSMGRYLVHKYLFYALPFTGLSWLLVLVSCHLLHVEGPIWWLSLYASTVIVWVVVAMALGFGVLYADFKAENKTATLGGMGAILFLLTSLAFQVAVLASGAWPAAQVARAWLKGVAIRPGDLALLILWAVALLLAAGLVAGYFFKRGVERLETSG